MAAVFVLVNFVIIGFLYVWYLRLAAKWTLKTSLSRKLCWMFYGLVLLITVLNIAASLAIGKSASLVLGAVAHLFFGGWFFGKFAVNAERVPPGFVGGLKMTGVALVLLGLTCGVLLGVPALLLSGKS